MFADGSFEGSSRARAEILHRRTLVIDEATFWIKKIEAVSAMPPAQAAPLLEAHIGVRALFGDASARALKAFRIGDLITVALHDPARFQKEADRTKLLIQVSRETLLARITR
jgi:flagellar basal body L-ring protein FlgH